VGHGEQHRGEWLQQLSVQDLPDCALVQLRRARPEAAPACHPMKREARERVQGAPQHGPFAAVPFLLDDCDRDGPTAVTRRRTR
jgi:hypothetical protein